MLKHLPIPIGLLLIGAFSHYAAEYYKPQIEAELTTHAQTAVDALKQPKITAEADGQTIVLSGEVASEEMRRKAEDEVHQVAGVDGVRNQLKVTTVMSAASCEGVIDNILEHATVPFVGYGSILDPAAMPVLDNVASIMAACPQVDFEILGFAEGKLAQERYRTMSTARADAVIAQLVAKGVPSTRLTSIAGDAKDARDRIGIRAKK